MSLAALIPGLRLPLAAALAGAVLLAGAYTAGVNAERKRGEAASWRQKYETLQADQRLAEDAMASAGRMAAAMAAADRIEEEELNALRKILADCPDSSCNPASDAALDRLYPGN